MTRHKQHLIQKINDLEAEIEIDRQLSFSCAPANAYAEIEAEIYRLWEELAHLRHYESAETMFRDGHFIDDDEIWNHGS